MSGCSGLVSGCLRNCRLDTPEFAKLPNMKYVFVDIKNIMLPFRRILLKRNSRVYNCIKNLFFIFKEGYIAYNILISNI